MFTRLDELKSSIRMPAPTPTSDPIVEALKAISDEVKALKASIATKAELKNAINSQTSTIVKMKDDVVTKAGKYVSDVVTFGYYKTPTSYMR